MPRILVVDDNQELLALLSSAFEDAGYTVQTAQRGRSALDLAKRERPDLAIVDVLLPDLMGFEVGEALQRQKIPVAFMSGVHKGGKAASNALYKYGAVGYFEKPFDRKNLLALVEKLVPVRPASPGQAWDVEAADGVDGPADAMELTGRIDLTSGGTSSSILGAPVNLRANSPSSNGPPVMKPIRPPESMPPVLSTMAPPGPSNHVPPSAPPQRVRIDTSPGHARPQRPPSIEIELKPTPAVDRSAVFDRTALTDRPPGLQRRSPSSPGQSAAANAPTSPGSQSSAPQLSAAQLAAAQSSASQILAQQSFPPGRLASELGSLPIERGSVHRGTIDDNLPQLFAAFLAAQETGELGLSRGQVKKIVYFEGGMPVFALSNLVAERLGQFLVRAGKIDEETLKHALQEAHDTSQRTGDVLILMGLLTEQERLYYVGQQIKSILYSLFAWNDGQYQLSFQDRARKERIKLDIHPATLVLRGIKKLYKPERLLRILALDDRPLPGGDPLFALSDIELAGWEALMIARCDGTRTARDLIALSGKPELEALGTLVALVSMRILERRAR